MKHYLWLLLLLSVFLAASPLLVGQPASSYSFTLLDEHDDQPVADAFVFFSGSSVGAISDVNGKVEIEWQPYAELVISHLIYETKVLSAEAITGVNQRVILLTPQAVGLDEVTVTYSGQSAAKRKQWLKQFEKAFLGSKRDRKGVVLLNPEAILFEETEAGLRAEAVAPIRIKNDALGYQLSFLLDTFLLTPKDEVQYGGKVFFEDLQFDQDVSRAPWKSTRAKLHLSSKARFFQSLVGGTIDPEQYEIGRSRFTDQLEFVDHRPVPLEELNWKRGIEADTLFFPDFLSVVNRGIVTKWGNRTSYRVAENEYATSFLRARSGKFIFSPSGVLINHKEIEELGYWAEQRVARLLPINYGNHGAKAESPKHNKQLDSLAAYHQAYPQEKLYLHLDKPYYAVNDDIWFKAYLLDGSTHQPMPLSGVVYVELIDPDGRIVRTLRLHKDRSMAGNFHLGRGGLYHIRAYTHYMGNQDPAFFYRRAIFVFDPALPEDRALTGIDLAPEPVKKMRFPFHLRISPEGGHLVAGLKNTIALQLTDTLGQPLARSGGLFDNSGAEVLDWSTNPDGWGLVKFTPSVEKSYEVQVPFQGRTYRVPFPEAAASGVILHVNNTRSEEFYLSISASAKHLVAENFLIGHVRGEVFCRITNIQTDEDIAFKRAQIPPGVACFSLFNQGGDLLAERIFFNDVSLPESELRLEAPYAFFRPRQEVVLTVQWADSLVEQGASLSVAVTDRSLVHYPIAGENIRDYLWLDADLPSPVSRPEAFLESPDQRKRFLLDLQLMGADRHRFSFRDARQTKWKDTARLPEYGATIEGFVTKKDRSDERVKAEVLLTALHPQPTLLKVITDDQGEFTFSNLPYLDSVDYVLQAAVFEEGKTTDAPVINSNKRKVDLHLRERDPPHLAWSGRKQGKGLKLPSGILERFLEVEAENSRQDSLYGARWQIDLSEVTVGGARVPDSRNFDVFNLNRLDWIEPEYPAYNLLTTLRPSNRYIKDMTTDVLQAEITDGQGRITRVPVTIQINGLPASFTRFQQLRADLIDYLVIERTFIGVTTRSQPRAGERPVSDGLLVVHQEGYYPGQPFPGRDYSQPQAGNRTQDLRAIVHWEPNLRIEPGGKTLLRFYAADTPTDYEVRVEGISDAGDPVFTTFIIKISN